MHIDLFGVVLFLHITVAIIAFAMAGVFHAALPAMSRAENVSQMRPWAAIVHRLDPLFPLFALLLLGLGVWLVHLGHGTDDAFSFKDGWVVTAIVALVVVEGLAGATLAPTAKKLVAKVHDSADGALSDELRRLAMSPKIWFPGHIATFGFLGVVFLMAAKPAGEWAWLFPAVGAVVGVALAKLQLDRLAVAGSGDVPAQRAAAEAATEARA